MYLLSTEKQNTSN